MHRPKSSQIQHVHKFLPEKKHPGAPNPLIFVAYPISPPELLPRQKGAAPAVAPGVGTLEATSCAS